MSPQELARLLEREHLCEICHHHMATTVFDRQLVCAGCWLHLERKLANCG